MKKSLSFLHKHRRWLGLGVCTLATTALAISCGGSEEEDDEVVTDESALTPAPSGLIGEYFDDSTLSGPKQTRTDARIDFNWGKGSPISGIHRDTFSVRWTGKIVANYSDVYTFYAATDDGVRVKIDGQTVIDDWHNHSVHETTGTVALTAGKKVDLVVEYYDHTGSAVARLLWSSVHQGKQIVPTSNLFTGPDTGTTSSSTSSSSTSSSSSGTGGTSSTSSSTTGGSTTTSTGSGGTPPPTGPTIAGCQIFPADNAWNTDISNAAVDAKSAQYIAYINASGGTAMHPDFGSYAGYGIPYVVVPGSQPKVPMSFDYASDSNPGPYPFPANAPVEPGSDRHVLVLDQTACKLYETWDSHYLNPGWHCGSGAIWDLHSNAGRPDGWTSADAAGLPILPGLVRYEEAVTAGEIRHALRFTTSRTQRAYVAPASHFASSITDANAPPMGLRLRLKASFDTSGYHGAAKVILEGLKKYGMILADNGANWFVSGTSNPGFDDDDLNQLKNVSGNAFEAIATGPIHH